MLRIRETSEPDRSPGPEAAELHEDGLGSRGPSACAVSIEFEPTFWDKLTAMARAGAITPLALAATAYALLLQRLAGGPVCVSLRFPGRGATASNGQPTVAVALDVVADCDFVDAARRLSRILEDAARGGVAKMAQGEECGYAFALESASGVDKAPDVSPAAHPPKTDWKLELTCRPARERARGAFRLAYDPACFSEARAASLLEAYVELLQNVFAAPRSAGAAYALARRHDQAGVWPRRPPVAPCALDKSLSRVDKLFDAITSRWPGATAAAWQGGNITFAELSNAAEAVANALRTGGAGGGEIVAFRLQGAAPAQDWVLYLAAQIAAFRLDCAVMPLGQRLEIDQAALQLEAMQSEFLIDAVTALDVAPEWVHEARRFSIDGFPRATLLVRPRPAARLGRGAAIVLATSGSTGAPKAIRLSHANLFGFLRGFVASGAFPALPTVMGSNIAFDVAIGDLWLAWACGRHVVILPTERRTPAALAMARDLGARVISLSPTVANAALREDPTCFAGFHTLILAGEVLPRALANLVGRVAPDLALVNGYGPAEMSILATVHRVAPQGEGSVPVGLALDGYTVLIACPKTGWPLPRHWPGELLIAGPAPALGYADAKLTAARFVPVPGRSSGPFFRTGDLGWVDDLGQVRFIGRHDRQHKLAGVRIELDGIEHVISQVEGVAEVAALVVGREGAWQVAAAVKPALAGFDPRKLRDSILNHCRAWLPRAGVPARIKFLGEIPTSGSGKKAHAELRLMLEERPSDETDRGGLPEAGSIEARLASLWREHLAASPYPLVAVHLDDDIFALGATSLDAVAVLDQIDQAFAIHFPEDQIFVRTTIRGQAEVVRDVLSCAPAPGAPVVAKRRIMLHLARPARAPGASAGLVLGLPGFRGDSYFTGLVAASAFDEFDVYAASCDLGGMVMDDVDTPLEVAEAICAAIIRGEIARPAALMGFSVSGWMTWLVERQLVAHGFGSIPIVNFDGGPLHLYYEEWRGKPYAAWREKVTALALRAQGGPRAEMLLLHRPHCRRVDDRDYSFADDWTTLDVDVFGARLRSLLHMEGHSSEVIHALRPWLSSFVRGPRDHSISPLDIFAPGPGGAAYEMLEAPHPPEAGEMRELIGRLPGGRVEPELQAPVLFLATASGDADLALAFARRLADDDSNLRFAVYAEVAILAATGRREAALERAAAWMRHHPNDEQMRARAQAPFAPACWEGGPAIARFPTDSLDFAVGFIADAFRGLL